MFNPLDIKKYISGVNFPVGKDDLIAFARDHGAPQQFIQLIENFTDKEYRDEGEVTEEATQKSGIGNLM